MSWYMAAALDSIPQCKQQHLTLHAPKTKKHFGQYICVNAHVICANVHAISLDTPKNHVYQHHDCNIHYQSEAIRLITCLIHVSQLRG